MAAQRVEELLETARDQAAHDRTVPLDAADAGRPLDPRHRRRTDEADLDPLNGKLYWHVRNARHGAGRAHPCQY